MLDEKKAPGDQPGANIEVDTSLYSQNPSCQGVKARFEEYRNWYLRTGEVKFWDLRYWELREAYALMISRVLQAPFPWSWWVTLSTRDEMPLEVIKGRFFWWIKILRRSLKQRFNISRFELIWFLERQRRGALHVHCIISNIPTDDKDFWRRMITTWETFWTKEGKFGSATIIRYDPVAAGKLSMYLAKERCKDLDVLDGSGSIFEKFGFSRGVQKYLDREEPINAQCTRTRV